MQSAPAGSHAGAAWARTTCRLHDHELRGLPDDLALAECGEGLVEDGLAVGVAAPLLHVGQVGLVGLVPRRRGRGELVLAGREAAAGAVPGLRWLHTGLLGEAR